VGGRGIIIIMIRFKCPNCAKGFTVDESRCGKKGKCPGCKSIIVIPEAGQASPASRQGVLSSQDKDQFLDLKELQKPEFPDDRPDSVISRQAALGADEEQRKEEKKQNDFERKFPWVIDVFLYPANITGLIMMAILAGIPFLIELLSFAVGYLGLFGAFFYFLSIVIAWAGLFIAFVIALYKYWYFCQCVLDSAEGNIRASKGFGDNPGLADIFSGVVNVIISLLLAFAPAIVYGYATGQLDRYTIFHFLVSALPARILGKYLAMDWIFYVLLGLGVIFFPMSFLSIIMHGSIRGLNPILLITSIFRTFLQYICIVLVFLVLFLLVQYFHYRIYYQRDFLLWLCRRFVMIYLSLIIAHLLGRFYYKNFQKLNWDV
jgi:hypothetical protein